MELDLSNTTELKTRTKLRNIKRKIQKIIQEDIYSIRCAELNNRKGYVIQGQLLKGIIDENDDSKYRMFIIPSWKDETKLKEEINLIGNKIINNESDVKEVIQNEKGI